MASETAEFATGASALAKARQLRARAGSLRAGRGVGGVTYGLAAYGYPLGAITGVQGPTTAPVEQPLGEQFTGGESTGGDGGGSV